MLLPMNNSTRLQRAIDFIEENIHEEFSMDDVAQAAAISKWHFQMVFSALLGETVKDYVRHRRLTLAAGRLMKSDVRILDIALESGFQSQEAFTRAFKIMFGMTPGACRRLAGQTMMLPARPRITLSFINHLYGGVTMKPVYKTLDAMSLVGVQTKFIASISEASNNFKVISKLWQEEFGPRRHEIQNLAGSNNAGVMLPHAGLKSHPDEMMYVACTPIKGAAPIPKGMVKVEVPAGKYAVFTHKGHIENISHTVNYIYGSWLPKAKEEVRHAPHVELYDHRFGVNSPDSEMEICVPVK